MRLQKIFLCLFKLDFYLLDRLEILPGVQVGSLEL